MIMKKLLTLLLLLPLFGSAQEWVIWNNELWWKSGPNDSINYGPSYLQPMIEVIRNKFENVETNKLSNPIPEGTIGVPFYRRVLGSNVTTTGQTLVDITGLSAALQPNSAYEFQANLSVSTSAVTTGIQYGVQYSAAGASVEANINGPTTTTASKGPERILTLNATTTTFMTTSNQHGGIRIIGLVFTGANAGNLTIRHLKVTSGTSTVFINSFMKLTRIQ